MDSFLEPVGDLPPEVYWRRRIITLAFFLLAVVVLYYLIKGAFSGDDSDATPDPSGSPSSFASPDVAITGVAACGVADLLIDLSRTTRDFPYPSYPTFVATVTHTGLGDCLLDTQAADTELVITSGPTASPERYWSNLDCAQVLFEGSSILLSPNETVTLTAEWPRIRSNESCQTGLATPQPGTYHAVLTIEGVESSDAVFTLSD